MRKKFKKAHPRKSKPYAYILGDWPLIGKVNNSSESATWTLSRLDWYLRKMVPCKLAIPEMRIRIIGAELFGRELTDEEIVKIRYTLLPWLDNILYPKLNELIAAAISKLNL